MPRNHSIGEYWRLTCGRATKGMSPECRRAHAEDLDQRFESIGSQGGTTEADGQNQGGWGVEVTAGEQDDRW